MVEALPPASTTIKPKINTAKFMGASHAAGNALAKQVYINTHRISFLKNVIDSSSLRSNINTVDSSSENRRVPLSETLVETNRILVEIHNQLATDYANRLGNEKAQTKKLKLTSDRKRRGDTEAKVESNIFSGIVSRAFNKVTSPIKGVFGRLLQFFGWIGAGFLANKGLQWLGKNPETISNFFNAITKNWRLITGLVIGGIIGKVVFDLVFLYQTVRGIMGALGIRRIIPSRTASVGSIPGSSASVTRRGIRTTSPWWMRNTSSLSRSNASYSRFISGRANIGDRLRLLRRGQIGVSGLFNQGMKGGVLQGQAGRIKFPVGKFKLPKALGGLKGSNILGLIGIGFDIYGRKQAGQTNFQTAAGVGGGLAGAKLGALAGAKIGVFLGPKGIAAGGIIGGLLGYFGGSSLMDQMTGANKSPTNVDKISNLVWDKKKPLELMGGGKIEKGPGGALQVLPPIKKSSAMNAPFKTGGNSIPRIGAVDISNEYVDVVRFQLGIFG